MEIYHFPDMKSRTHHDSIMMISRIGWTLFPFLPRTVFPGNGGGEEMERDTVMICIVMDANTNWVPFFFLSLSQF